MNRRDYLKRMGLATAVAMGSNHVAGLRAFARSSSEVAAAPPANTGEWPIGSRPDPKVFDVKLIFAGMCIFGYNGKVAHVAFHRGHTETHKMEIIVSEAVARERERICSEIYKITDGSHPANIKNLQIGINGKASNANFFLGSSFDRNASTTD